jgi:hypothetical protein
MFGRKKKSDKTVISTSEATISQQKAIYVEAETHDLALEIWEKVREKQKP